MRLAADVATPSGIDRHAVESALGVAAATDLHLQLVGDPGLLSATIGEVGADRERVEIVAADDVIGGDEDPAVVRGRPRASVRVALDLVRAGTADAVLSVGAPDVVAAAAAFSLGRVRGHRRPCLAVEVGTTVVVYAGGVGRATSADLAAAVGELARDADRVALLTTDASSRADEFHALVRARTGNDVDVATVGVSEVLAGVVDVVACPEPAGTVFLETVTALAPDDVGPLVRVVGVPVPVACLRAGTGRPVTRALAAWLGRELAGGHRGAA